MNSPLQQNRGITFARDAINNVVVNGDNNHVQVTLYVADQRLLPAPQQPASGPLSNPYRGLDSFQELDADIFFGRSKLTRRAWLMFQQLQAGDDPRILAIVGASGSGKSSLVRAGLVPELAREPLSGSETCKVLILRPGREPLNRLAEVLNRLSPPFPIDPVHMFSADRSSPASALHEILLANADQTSGRVVIIVDQFEELFTVCEDSEARISFLEQLSFAASHKDLLATVVFTVRSDFAAAVRAPVAFARAVRENRLQIRAMDAAELEEAIARPAIRFGHPWPPILIQNLVAQAEGRSGALPLLQFALKRLWPDLAAGTLDQNRWSSQLIEDFLVQAAESLYEKANSSTPGTYNQGQRIIRRAFLAMVQFGEGTEDTRRIARLAEIVAEKDDSAIVQRVLAPFSAPEARLITASELDEEPVYELTHESLISSWDRLRSWLGDVPDIEQRDRIRAEQRLQRSLAIAAREWQSHRGSLWRSPELDLLRAYIKRRSPELTSAERGFANASMRQAATERNVRLFGVIALVVLLVASITGTIIAMREAKTAESQRTSAGIAFARSLVAGANPVAALRILRERLAVESQSAPIEADLLSALYSALAGDHLIAAIKVDNVDFAAFEPKTGDILLQRRSEIQRYNPSFQLISRSPLPTLQTQGKDPFDEPEPQPLIPVDLPSMRSADDNPQTSEHKIVSPDGAYYVKAEDWGQIYLSDKTGRVVTTITDRQYQSDLSSNDYRFNPNGKSLFISHSRGEDETTLPELIDVATGKRIFSLESGLQKISLSAFDASGERLLTVSDEGVVALWATGANIFSVSGDDHPEEIGADSDLSLLRLTDQAVVARLSTGQVLVRTKLDFPALRGPAEATTNFYLETAVSKDQKWIWIKVATNTAELWSLSTGTLRQRVVLPTDISAMNFSPALGFAIASTNKEAWLFSLRAPQNTDPIKLPPLEGIPTFDAAESVVASRSTPDGHLNIWRLDTGTLLQSIQSDAHRLNLDEVREIRVVQTPSTPTPTYEVDSFYCFATLSARKVIYSSCSGTPVGRIERGKMTLLAIRKSSNLSLLNSETGAVFTSFSLPQTAMDAEISQLGSGPLFELSEKIAAPRDSVDYANRAKVSLIDLNQGQATPVASVCLPESIPEICGHQVLFKEGPLAGQLVTLPEMVLSSASQNAGSRAWIVTDKGKIMTIGPGKDITVVGSVKTGDLEAFRLSGNAQASVSENSFGTTMVCFNGPCLIAKRDGTATQVFPEAQCQLPLATSSQGLFLCSQTSEAENSRLHIFSAHGDTWSQYAALPSLVEKLHPGPWMLSLKSDPTACSTLVFEYQNGNADDSRSGQELWYLPANNAVMQLDNPMRLSHDQEKGPAFLDGPTSLVLDGTRTVIPHRALPAICTRADAIRLIDSVLSAASIGLDASVLSR